MLDGAFLTKSKSTMTNPTMTTTTTALPSPSNGVHIMEANAAAMGTGEKKGGPSFVPAMLTYDVVQVAKCPKKKENPIGGCTLGDAVVSISLIHPIKKLKKGAP